MVVKVALDLVSKWKIWPTGRTKFTSDRAQVCGDQSILLDQSAQYFICFFDAFELGAS